MEWTNLAGQSKYDEVKKNFARHLPEVNAEDSPSAGQKGKAGGRAG